LENRASISLLNSTDLRGYPLLLYYCVIPFISNQFWV